MSFWEIWHRLNVALRHLLGSHGILTVSRPPAARVAKGSEYANWVGNCRIEQSPYLKAANRLLEGQETVFALTRRIPGKAFDWNRDPATARSAPLTFGKRLNVSNKDIVGDIKYVWEPNRHAELVTLSQAYALSNDDAYLCEIEERLTSWLDQCPYPLGVNWSSGLEVAIRLVNWSVVWQLIGGRVASLFEGEQGALLLQRWLDSIYQHVHFIRSDYSRFSSANNHLIGEAAGAFIATCTWPYWQNFDTWRQESRLILIDAAKAQTHADGVNREQAFGYQQFVLDFFILSGCAGRKGGVEFPDEYWQTIEKMIEFIQEMMDVNGNMPMFGDADDGFVVQLSQEEGFCPFKSLLATGAILFGRPDFAAKSGRLDDKTRYLLGEEGFSSLLNSGRTQTRQKRRKFPNGGYYVLGREFDSSREIFMIADAGPLGYLSIAAHAHSDALAVYLSVAGREFLVDPGTYTYHGDPKWRTYFRSTRAHNTVVVDGEDQSVQGGPFLWTRHAKAACTKFESSTENDIFVGEHDGYARFNDPVIHQREIVRSGSEFEIIDTLRCKQKHSIERCWHFSEHCEVFVSGTVVTAENNGVMIRIVAEDPSTRVVSRTGSESPIGGWVSRRFDVKTPATSVYFVNMINGTSVLRARIYCQIS